MTKKNLPFGQAYIKGNKAYTKSNDDLLSHSIDPVYPMGMMYRGISIDEVVRSANEQTKEQIRVENGDIVIYQGSDNIKNRIQAVSPDIKEMKIIVGDTEFVSKEKLNDTEEKLQRALDTIKELRNIFSQTQ